MADSLSDAFPPVSKQEWVDKIVSDLKGKPYEKLVRTSESGVPIAPVYMASDLPADIAATYPGMNDHRRGHSGAMAIGQGGWITALDFAGEQLEDLEAIKAHFVQDMDVNVRGLRLVLNGGLRGALSENARGSGLVLDNWGELESVVEWANANGILLYIEAGDAAIDFLDSGLLGRISGALDLNPMLWKGNNGPHDEAIALCARAALQLGGKSDFLLFQLGLKELELAGANAVQQIAFALAMGSDLVDRLGQNGVDASAVFDLTSVHFPVSTDFFEEIGKFRAFRILWNRLQAAWGIDQSERSTYLIASSALSTETLADAHVNLLRHTTQAMAAAIGGCKVISIAAHDAATGKYDPEAVRLARNIQLVLKHESDFWEADRCGRSLFRGGNDRTICRPGLEDVPGNPRRQEAGVRCRWQSGAGPREFTQPPGTGSPHRQPPDPRHEPLCQ
ncbi:MAG: methylmalonyl-CoA mutase family protein [Bacteroidia bacterium]